jgi:tetratricopeptide (TPR) repeat protein
VQIYKQYCQSCRAANLIGEEFCVKCGTKLMLVVTPSSVKHEEKGIFGSSEEHVLERISHLELKLSQTSQQLGKTLELLMKLTENQQREHILIEVLVEALADSNTVDFAKLNQTWKERWQAEKDKKSIQTVKQRKIENILKNHFEKKSVEFKRLIMNAFDCLENSQEDVALALLEKAFVISPNNLPLTVELGETYFFQEKTGLALNYLQKSIKFLPDNKKIRLLLCLSLANEGKFDLAESHLRDWQGQKYFVISYSLAMVCAAQEKWADVLKAAQETLNTNPTAESNYFVGCAYFQLNRWKSALKYLQKAVLTDDNYSEAWLLLGFVYQQLKENQKAEDAFSKANTDESIQNSQISKQKLPFFRVSHFQKKILNDIPPRFIPLIKEEITKIMTESES